MQNAFIHSTRRAHLPAFKAVKLCLSNTHIISLTLHSSATAASACTGPTTTGSHIRAQQNLGRNQYLTSSD